MSVHYYQECILNFEKSIPVCTPYDTSTQKILWGYSIMFINNVRSIKLCNSRNVFKWPWMLCLSKSEENLKYTRQMEMLSVLKVTNINLKCFKHVIGLGTLVLCRYLESTITSYLHLQQFKYNKDLILTHKSILTYWKFMSHLKVSSSNVHWIYFIEISFVS